MSKGYTNAYVDSMMSSASLRREVWQATNEATSRVRTWQSHPSYDTKTGVKESVQRALTIVAFAGRVLGKGMWTNDDIYTWFDIDYHALETILLVVAGTKKTLDVNWQIPVVRAV